MTRPSVELAALVVLAALAWSAPARAQDIDAQLHAGVQLREHGDDEGAARVFRSVFEATHDAHAEAQLALAEQALGQWVAAEAHLREALASTTDAWVHSHRAVLETAMTTIATHVSELDLRGGVAGAEIHIDGRVVGTFPLTAPLHVETGGVNIEVTAPGYAPFQHRIEVTAGVLNRANVELVPVAPTAPPPPPPPHERPRETAPPPASDGPPIAPIVLGVAAVLALGTGIVATGFHEDMVSAYNGASCSHDGDTRLHNCGYLLPRIDAATITEVIGYATSGVLAALTLVLLLTAPHHASDRASATWMCSAQAGGPVSLGLECAGRF